jgi:BRCT domain type II-containing protein
MRKGNRKMKNAKEMKQKALQNCSIVKYIEETVAPAIEKAAAEGKTNIEVMTDNIPSKLGSHLIVDRVCEYLRGFDYFVDYTTNYKKITIDWNIVVDK